MSNSSDKSGINKINLISVSGTQTPCITYKGMKNVDDLFDDNIASCVTLDSPEGVLMTTLEVDPSCVNTSEASKSFYFTMCATHTSVSKTKRQDDDSKTSYSS